MTTTDTSAAAAVEAATRELHLPAIREHASRLATQAQRAKSTYLGYLADTLSLEVDDRAERRRRRLVREARFPRIKRLADFDFDAARRSTRPPSPHSPPAATSTPATPWC
jgi:DNA replication protein DnaC